VKKSSAGERKALHISKGLFLTEKRERPFAGDVPKSSRKRGVGASGTMKWGKKKGLSIHDTRGRKDKIASSPCESRIPWSPEEKERAVRKETEGGETGCVTDGWR